MLHQELHCSLSLSPLAEDVHGTSGGAGAGGGGGGGGGGRGGAGGFGLQASQLSHLHQAPHMLGLHEAAHEAVVASPGRRGHAAEAPSEALRATDDSSSRAQSGVDPLRTVNCAVGRRIAAR